MLHFNSSSKLALEDLPVPNLEVRIDERTSEEVYVLTSLDPTDPTRPDNWNRRTKLFVFLVGILLDFSSTLGSTLPSNAISYISKTFNVQDQVQLTLPISLYVVGFVVGPIVWGPLSETFGRKPMLLYPFIGYAVFTIGTALSPNWTTYLVFRCLRGLMASSPIAVVGGLFSDIYTDTKQRGIYLTYFIAVSGFGPCLGSIFSGILVEHASWRWIGWLALILAIVSLPLIILMPETYQAIILKQRAAALRKATGNSNIITETMSDLDRPSAILTIVLVRPFQLLVSEAIVFFSCLYLALIYGVFYLTFEAWPLAFRHIYGMGPALEGTSYIPFGLGCVLAVVIFFQYDNFLTRSQARGAAWSLQPEYRRLVLACIGGPLWTVSLFWIAWSVRQDLHPIVPMLSGIPLGAGYLLIFIAILNYLSDAYTIYSASAHSIASTTRSVAGAILPLASPIMYQSLGFQWSCSLLGFLSVAMIGIPFAFLLWGSEIRAKSKFCNKMILLREKGLELSANVFDNDAASIQSGPSIRLTQEEAKESIALQLRVPITTELSSHSVRQFSTSEIRRKSEVVEMVRVIDSNETEGDVQLDVAEIEVLGGQTKALGP